MKGRMLRQHIVALAMLLLPGVAHPATAAIDPLLAEVLAGDHSAIERRLRRGEAAERRLPDGSKVLAWAIERQDARAVALLLAHGAQINDEAPQGNAFRPLIVACRYPSDPVLTLLLDEKPSIDVHGPDGIPALSLCAAYASESVVARLIALGAEVNEQDDNGQTPLMWAAAHGRIDTATRLINAGARLESQSAGGLTPLMFAVKSGSADMAEALVDAGANPRVHLADGTSLLQLALYQDNFAFAERLLSSQSELHRYDLNGHKPLHVAARAGHAKLAARLLELGADINARTGKSTIPWRYESNFKAGDYQFPELPPLLLAAQQGHAAVVSLLGERGADLDATDDRGNNVVLTAAASGSAAALGAALELVPQVDKQNQRGQTALHRVLQSAEGRALTELLEVLAQHGARTDIPDANGKSAADLAAAEHFPGKLEFERLFERNLSAAR
ncbi:MAG: ankyrin repeat domain-containing protein [Pseudomonadota bacterium]